jgi:hypothetical protein
VTVSLTELALAGPRFFTLAVAVRSSPMATTPGAEATTSRSAFGLEACAAGAQMRASRRKGVIRRIAVLS